MSSATIQRLKFSWESLLQTLQVEPSRGEQVFLDLVTAYSSVGRFYHNLEHIKQVLETIEQLRRGSPNLAAQVVNFPAIQLAAWFHDVIYDPKCNDNEEKSAEYAAVVLENLKLPIATAKQVNNLILNTKTHQALPTDIDSQILLDSDLAIIGATDLEYRAYAQAIRQEYSWVPDQRYRVGRKQVLQKLWQRERIYFTNQMFATLEIRARQNMQAEIAALSL